jgi:5'-nucleotidase
MTHILVTNDDGVNAPGLLALVQALRAAGKVTVCVPDRNWSGGGHVKTLHKPLRAWDSHLTDGTAAIVSDGAPSDCVALAVLGLVTDPIDLVVSGINAGANLGYDLTYSGTVTAAMEAVISGIPGIAVSLVVPESDEECRYESAARAAASIVQVSLRSKIPQGILLNVNVPYPPEGILRGVRVTRQGLRIYRDALVTRKDPRGRPYYWIGGEPPSGVLEDGTDIQAVSEGYVSITPVQLDLTAHTVVRDLQEWDWSIE